MANANPNQQPQPWVPLGVNPPTFDGTKLDGANKWLRKFTRYAQASGVAGNDRCNIFGLLLTGMAETWFNSLPDATRANFNLLEQAFIAQFVDVPAASIQRKIQVVNRTQFLGETVDSYFTDARSKFEGQNLPVDFEVALLINGLRQDIRAVVMQQGPYANVADLLDKCRRVEASLPPAPVSAYAMHKDMFYEDETSEMTDVRSDMKEMKEAIKKLTEQMSRSRQSTPQRQVSFSDQVQACYNCGRTGHFARNCRFDRTRYRQQSPGNRGRRPFNPNRLYFQGRRRSPSPRRNNQNFPNKHQHQEN